MFLLTWSSNVYAPVRAQPWTPPPYSTDPAIARVLAKGTSDPEDVSARASIGGFIISGLLRTLHENNENYVIDSGGATGFKKIVSGVSPPWSY